MASPDGGATPASLDHDRLRDHEADSESGSSHIGSDASDDSVDRQQCRWRTARFHNGECSRYFDCPTHVVERMLSDNEADDGEEEGEEEELSEHHQTDDDMAERSSSTSPEPRPTASAESADASDLITTSFAPGLEETNTEQAADGPDTARATSARDIQEPQESQVSEEPQESQVSEEPAPAPPTPLSSRLSESSGYTQPLPPTATPAQPTGEFVPLDRTSSLVPSPVSNFSTQIAPLRPALPSHLSQEGPPPPPRRASSSTAASSSRAQPTAEDRRSPPEFVLPRWQPDAEVTLCPICHTQFSIFEMR
ncbi:hypothetical protein C8034_v001270 [Colletotrichum sidae]|uniref:Uncharacterized protein n=1 Tax=Colletotrichum sidae TaxID=1347389 RepID=A0A4R8TEV7_9PEZI|nr:hypothetical protein C8034_v001270 [Colletotrichum sidae]